MARTTCGGRRMTDEEFEDEEFEKEELWSTEVWLKNMMYYLKTEMFMFTGRL